jgi:hypothetical protein
VFPNGAANVKALHEMGIRSTRPERSGRRRLMVTCDGAGASHKLIGHLDELASRPGRELTYSARWELGARDRTAIGLIPSGAQLSLSRPKTAGGTACT